METQTELSEWMRCDLQEVEQLVKGIYPLGSGGMAEALLAASRVFVAGHGRSGLVVRMFAMRLMQVGIQTFITGDTLTPSIREGDLLVAVSGSGETEGVVRTARRAKTFKARVAAITSKPESTLAHLADFVTVIPGETTMLSLEIKSRLPLASALEQATLVYLDCLVAWLAAQMDQTNATMMAMHANLD